MGVYTGAISKHMNYIFDSLYFKYAESFVRLLISFFSMCNSNQYPFIAKQPTICAQVLSYLINNSLKGHDIP